jgi:multidrug transporter EmrE-like cation transporter
MIQFLLYIEMILYLSLTLADNFSSQEVLNVVLTMLSLHSSKIFFTKTLTKADLSIQYTSYVISEYLL